MTGVTVLAPVMSPARGSTNRCLPHVERCRSSEGEQSLRLSPAQAKSGRFQDHGWVWRARSLSVRLRIRPITRRLEAMKPCSACVHPDRAVIDSELLEGVSLRTVAGRHGLSTTAVHRHRTQHLEGAIIGDIIAPDPVAFELGGYMAWARWTGSDWEDLGPVRPADLLELRGRRLGGQRVYRFRRARS